jgi:hypothetical protein
MDYEIRRTIENLRLKARRIRYAKTRRQHGMYLIGFKYMLICPVWLRLAFEKSLKALDEEENSILKEIKRLRTAVKERAKLEVKHG